MRADIADTLRALAREHLEGRSSLERYRRQRAALLDGLLAPRAAPPASDVTQPRELPEREVLTQPRAVRPLEPTSPPAAVPPPAVPPPAVPPRSPPSPARPAPRRGKAGMWRAAALTALGLLLAVGVVLLIRHQRSGAVAAHPAAAVAASTVNSTPGADPIHTLLEPLLNDDDWSDASVLALNEALRKYDPARIAADRNSDWFHTAVEIVRFRLKQQQALTDAPLSPATSPIAALAQTLGIDLPAPEEPAPATKPAAPRKDD
jgi:hypothetical protein